jgi:hypothetical protein
MNLADTPLPQTNYILVAAGINIGCARVWRANNKRSRSWNVLENNTEGDYGEIGWKGVELINLALYRNQWCVLAKKKSN